MWWEHGMAVCPPPPYVPVVLNNVRYCPHGRDFCYVCGDIDTGADIAPRPVFQLPECGETEYPAGLGIIRDAEIRELLGKRWLEMQQVMFPRKPMSIQACALKLPAARVPAEARASAQALQACLLHQFHQLRDMAARQRYFFANHSRNMLEEYETFAQAAVLYQKVLKDSMRAARRFFGLDCGVWRSQAGIATTFGYFLGQECQRTFWRVMEITAEGFLEYLGDYNEARDGEVVMDENAKACLLEWLGHAFWSLQHAQYCLDKLRLQQHSDFLHKNNFPFYPYRAKQALKDGLDVHVLIAKLSMASLHDFPLFSSLFSQLNQAIGFTEQMQDINVEVMAVMDELSTRYRYMEALILAASSVGKRKEVKAAIVAFKFDREEVEEMSATSNLNLVDPGGGRTQPPPPRRQGLPILQGLLVEQAWISRKHMPCFLRAPMLTSEPKGHTVQMFEAFRREYRHLHHNRIRPDFKRLACSLLRRGKSDVSSTGRL